MHESVIIKETVSGCLEFLLFYSDMPNASQTSGHHANDQ